MSVYVGGRESTARPTFCSTHYAKREEGRLANLMREREDVSDVNINKESFIQLTRDTEKTVMRGGRWEGVLPQWPEPFSLGRETVLLAPFLGGEREALCFSCVSPRS